MIASLDIDGFRFDKAGQVTVDAFADYSESIRDCARRFGKDNFLLSGELTGGNDYASVYIGRGRQPEMTPKTFSQAVLLTNASEDSFFLRAPGKSPVDSAAFHYSIYRSLNRFLGMDGNISAMYDVDVDFVQAWNQIVMSNDLTNVNTGLFDPRHMLGTTNQDNFRWPSIKQGTEKMLLGQFITTLHIPGVPLLLWGEEQAFYILDSPDASYNFGRQPMSSSLAWQTQGCNNLGSSKYTEFPVDAAMTGCNDDSVSLDHRDPTHPIRNILKVMYYLREQFPTLNDGYYLKTLSKQTHEINLPGSYGIPTETGMWSVLRDQYEGGHEMPPQASGVWLVYQNENKTVQYDFDCSSSTSALIAPFDEATVVKNLLAPFDEITLKSSQVSLGISNSTGSNGCLDSLELQAFDFKAYVPKTRWIAPPPMMTKFSPGHDARITSTVSMQDTESIMISFEFSEELDCDLITKNLLILSSTQNGTVPALDISSVSCQNITAGVSVYTGEILSTWSWSGKLDNVAHGVHTLTVRNASSTDGSRFTNSIDHLMFRTGRPDNPVVFPRSANYSHEALDTKSGDIIVTHLASGADKWRFSTNWGSSWSDWEAYTGGSSVVAKQPWSGTKKQKWDGEHVILQYWSGLAGSGDHIQHVDVGKIASPPRRFPHLFAFGDVNRFGADLGAKDEFSQHKDGWWSFHMITEWPTLLQVNVWGKNPDHEIDRTYVLGDVMNSSVLNRLPPDSLSQAMVNLTEFPPSPYIAYRLEINDGTMRYRFVPEGSRTVQMIVYVLLWVVSPLAGAISVWIYMGAFYGVKFNRSGVTSGLKKPFLPFFKHRGFQKVPESDPPYQSSIALSTLPPKLPPVTAGSSSRRTVLIATMEYDIEDWKIKIKIGGLGVMAQLMGKNLPHQDLIWVVPCVGDVEYPIDPDGYADSMHVILLGKAYEIKVQYHQLRNITYVLLDAPVFRQQTKSEPYPPRMDDLDSAIYYSAWNACIAETIKRFPIDIYHINDYHGAAAPLYLLPDTIPCCLSLHNAEFQGLWPMRSQEERTEVSRVFNLHLDTIEKYVQFGEVFNLLHAGASYLRVHQKGFGAVGVSNKYGDRSYARYPIFWGLKEIGKLPNPDPSDTEPWDPEAEARQVITVDPSYEASRGDLRRQAQEWAQLEVNPQAELFVFVGRWSVQKGVDLIADVFPAVLEKHRNVQLICIGPVIDMYGKFAALKLGEMMKKYPRRVYSKPEFTALPPHIFSGAEFALIPSRDEPFGLVAVEFGRKGALGVGARVGGLGQMPGWWYTVESTTPKHLQKQFKAAIEKALSCKTDERAMMRAKSAKQRFPVARWVEDLDHLQSSSIKVHNIEQQHRGDRRASMRQSVISRPRSDAYDSAGFYNQPSRDVSMERFPNNPTPPADSDAPLGLYQPPPIQRLERTLSLGLRIGPGHESPIATRPGYYDIPNLIVELDEPDDEEFTISPEQAEAIIKHDPRACQEHQACRDLQVDDRKPDETYSRGRHRSRSSVSSLAASFEERERSLSPLPRHSRASPEDRGRSLSPFPRHSTTSLGDRGRSLSPFPRNSLVPEQVPRRNRASSVLSINDVKGNKNDFMLQKVDATFKDSNGDYYRQFEGMLQSLGAKTSENELCIEEFLVKSEKEWATKLRDVKMGRHQAHSPSPSIFRMKRDSAPGGVLYSQPVDDVDSDEFPLLEEGTVDEFLLPNDFRRPSLLKRWLTIRVFDWPVYSFFLGLGQILAANSYQITLLAPSTSQASFALYVFGAVYIITTCAWWYLFRRIPSRFVLTLPFIFYGLGFFLVGITSITTNNTIQSGMQYAASSLYITGSSSGSLFFALNFGDEGKFNPSMYVRSSTNFLSLSLRRRTNHFLGLPSLYYPRHTVDLHCRALLLGSVQEHVHLPSFWHLHRHTYRYRHLSLDRIRSAVHRPTTVLPPIPRQDPKLLSDDRQSKNHPLVPFHRRTPELLP